MESLPFFRENVNRSRVIVGAQDAPGVGSAQLLEAARSCHGRGWRPVPVRIEFDEDGRKVPSFPGGFTWTDLRDRAFTWEQTVSLFGRIEGANALAIVLEPGHIVLDLDSEEAVSVVAGCVLPDCPRCRTQAGGYHFHFRASAELTERSVKPGGGLEFLCRQLVFMPPSLGRYAWEALPDGDLPELPSTLATMLRLALNGGKLEGALPVVREATPRGERLGEAAPMGPGEWAEWEALLGGTKADGRQRRKAICPLHFETRPSFSVFRNEKTGRPQGHCFGCGFSGSLRQLRRALRTGDTTLYRAALTAVASMGDELAGDTRRVLLILIGEFQKRGLDPREALGWSYREFAAATGCEPLLFPENGPTNDKGKAVGVLAYRGKGVRRLFAKLAAEGVQVKIGRPRMAGRQGRRSELTLPPNWFAPVSTGLKQEATDRLHLSSSDVGRLEGKQAGEVEEEVERVLEGVLREFPGATIAGAGEEA